MSDSAQRQEVIRFWWSRAEDSLGSANREIRAESYTFAVNRLYYAAFYAVCAVLLDRHLSFRKHSGVRAAFHREFVKPGLLDSTWGKLYDQLFEDRQEGDYLVLATFEREYVEHQLSRTTAFLEQLRPLIASLENE